MDKIAKALFKARQEIEEEQMSMDSGDSATGIQQQPSLSVIRSEVLEEGSCEEQATGIPRAEKKVELPDGFSSEASVDPKLIVFHEPESLIAEHFKLLRSRILHPADGKELRTIMVTSAMENAGKTMIACNLALSIAQGVDPYAMLIDADVRKPSIEKMFGMKAGTGLTDYLRGEVTLSQCLVKPVISKLTILPSGNSVSNPAEIVTSSRMRELLEEAKGRYSDRFIIMDTPPVNMASETVDLAKLVDAILLVVRCGESRKPLVEQAISRLGRERIMGIIFNAYERPAGKYGYYKKKNYYRQ